MCRTSLWGGLGFLACAYFAWSAFGHVFRNSFFWAHDAWTAATYVVWVVLLTALMLDNHCWRERFFFGTLVINFLIGFGLTLWRTVPDQTIRTARIWTGVLWALAGVLSLATVGREKKFTQN